MTSFLDKEINPIKITFIWISIFFTIFLITTTTVSLSFKYPQYNQIAFVRNIYGKTDTETIIYPQRIFLPLTKTLIYFPSTAQQVTFFNMDNNAVQIYSETGLLFELDIAFIYFLTPDNLKKVYTQYSLSYNNIIKTLTTTTIKNIAIIFTPDDYINKKEYIQNLFAINVKNILESQVGVYVPIEYFFLQDVTFPKQIIDNALKSVVQIQNNELQEIIQENQIIIAQTDYMISEIQSQTNYTLSFAQIQASQIIANSLSYAKNMDLKSNNIGLMNIVQNLNITDVDRFIKIMSLYYVQNPKLLYGSTGTLISL